MKQPSCFILTIIKDMEHLSKAIGAVGHAAEVAGKLGENIGRFASGIKVPGGMSNAASKVYNAAKRLKSSVNLGSIGTKAINAARTFKNAVRGRATPDRIANTASRAASFIGRAAQGAGSTIKNSFQRYGGWTGYRNRTLLQDALRFEPRRLNEGISEGYRMPPRRLNEVPPRRLNERLNEQPEKWNANSWRESMNTPSYKRLYGGRMKTKKNRKVTSSKK